MKAQWKLPLTLLFSATLLAACAPVGSERWCEKMDEKPKGDWTANEAGDYAKYCIFGFDPDDDKKEDHADD